MKRNIIKILFIICTMMMLCGCSKSDPELNEEFSPLSSSSTYKSNSEYYYFYSEKFNNLHIDTVSLSMGLDWFVDQYDLVYQGEEKYFYVSAFNTPNVSTNELLNMYNNDKDNLYFLKPFLDCYILMDKNKEPSEEKMKEIKSTILYALDYYCNGKDYIGDGEWLNE